MSAAWSGRKVMAARAIVAGWLPAPCGQCAQTVDGTTPWVVGHKLARATHPELTWDVTNWQPEHRPCSDASSADVRRQVAGFSPDAGPREGLRAAALSPLVGPRQRTVNQIEVAEHLLWPNATQDAPLWLEPYVEVPREVAHEPTAMNPPHPDAVGSYGPALIEWARVELGVTVRWWQGLSLVRILEHRADGSLCWAEVLISCSRRAGKSVVLRLLALWRLVFAPALFGEMQLIVHSANTLRVAKEPMRYASKWARGQERLKVSTNNNNYSIEDEEGGHRWVVLPVDNTAGLDTNMGVIDEAWAAKPEIVDDDLEPTLMERISPQLLLISTAHRRSTSLMRNRISGALAGEESDRTLILFWAAQPNDDVGAETTWRRASPHWSQERHEYVARKYAKALRGEQDPEFDDADPMAGFRSQYTNAWLLKERRTVGNPVVEAEVWAALATALEPEDKLDGAAIESWYSGGVSLALAQREAGAVVVSVSDHDDLPAAVQALKVSGYRGRVAVGSSLADDPALRRIAKTPTAQRVTAAIADFDRLLTEGVLRHDDGEHLTEQVLQLRTVPGADGARVVSKERADAVKAAVWAVQSARRAPSGPPRILLPSGTE